MKAHVIGEPELEFRAWNRHIDPRYGVAVHGPADADSPSAPHDITVGGVGPGGGIDGMRGWLERCQIPIQAKEAKPGQENLHQPFPGFSTDTSFGAQLVFDDALVREIPEAKKPRSIPIQTTGAVAPQVVDGTTGKVTRIGIRSSTVKTFQGAELIIPNGNFISGKVINWTLSESVRRVD